jgi:hypothetical protein
LANVLVCLAVWLCFSARTTTDRILAIVPPVAAFSAAGFEHSIANMYLLSFALLTKFGAPAVFWETIGRTPSAFPHLACWQPDEHVWEDRQHDRRHVGRHHLLVHLPAKSPDKSLETAMTRHLPRRSMADTVFTAKDLTKTYTSGEVQVLALQGVDLEVWAEKWSSSPPAVGSRRC